MRFDAPIMGSSMSDGRRTDNASDCRRWLLGWVAGLTISTLVLGCTALKPGKSEDIAASPSPESKAARPDTQDETAHGYPVIRSEGDRYYYYLQSQIYKQNGDIDNAIRFLEKAIETNPGSLYLNQELVNLYLRQEKADKALRLLETLLASHPENCDLLILYGRLKQEDKDNAAAKAAYRKVLTIDPSQKDTYIRLGALLLDEGAYDEAYTVYQGLVKAFPDAYIGYFFMGKIHSEKGRLKAAETNFLKTISIAPDIDEPRFELLNIYEKQGQINKSLKIYEEFLTENPENIRASLALGYLYERVGKSDKSLSILAQLGKEAKDQPDIIRDVISYYIEPKRYKEAAVILEGMLTGAPDNGDLHYIAGVVYEGLGQKQLMTQHLIRVTSESRFYSNAVVNLAYVYQASGDVLKAVDYLIEVIKKTPGNPDFYLYLGTFYEELTKYDLAEATLKKGLELAPDHTRLYFRLGVVYDKWQRKGDSIAMMKTAISLDPTDANALNYLGYTYADMGNNLDEAESLIRQALKHKPGDGYIIDSLGWVYFKRGQYAQALTHLLKAATIVPDDPIILEHIGDAYEKMGDIDNALKYYQKSLDKRESDDTAGILEKINQMKKKRQNST